ncbi:citrate synthase/methylcitrate synthase [Cytobacillus sp. IB215316]|uniref:citrate synthase/methylcitrate synthase n=1 Tax=Cytobacillus sp. IB215316 TaxID=3097354 RepID=UPI002A0D6C21|nr:citrate synthase/methylcitrate synthase [Cytobacillus sp. IB215316]MDX8362053.1 citrate synthase/methylcitrate synthase [Cytobacillus sp. IB215316]
MLTMNKGLEGVIVANSEISFIDGQNGKLIYRGYHAQELAENHSYEEIVYLLLYGELPTIDQLIQLQNQLTAYRNIPEDVKNIIDNLPVEMDMMSVLRTAISCLGGQLTDWPPAINDAIRVIAMTPTIITYRYHRLTNTDFIEPDLTLDHVSNYLYMLTGVIPKQAHVKALSAYFVLTAEHGMNASTFSARTITSTQSDLISAIVGAIGAMKGPLHGGAPTDVVDMLNEINSKQYANKWITEQLEQGKKIMGFGHRVYKTHDPRALALRNIVQQLVEDDEWFDLAIHVEEEAIALLEKHKPGRKLYTNVEFYAAAVLRAVKMPVNLYTPTFTASRMAGWTAHVLEQAANNRIIRPKAQYIGHIPS